MWTLACAMTMRAIARARAQTATTTCVEPGERAIFVSYSENAPDAVFKTVDGDGCLAGGGRGFGCCPGSVCPRENCAAEENVTQKFYTCRCEPCARGTAQPLAARSACVDCPAGWYGDVEGAATCKPCPIGTYSNRVKNTVGCVPCEEGTSGTSSLEEYYAATTKSLRAPPAGEPGSTFDSTLAATSCTACPAGTYGGGAGSGCTPCAPGSYSLGSATSCAPCPANTYSTESGGTSLRSCQPCAAGEATDGTGSTSCFRVCPSTALTCAADEKRAAGFYEAAESGRRPVVSSSAADDIIAYKLERCRKGCVKLRERCRSGCDTAAFDFWCDSKDTPTENDCDKFPLAAPPPPSPSTAALPPPPPPSTAT